MMDERFKLCYIKDNWAYFTTQDIDKQWGDDWNDAPYEHNAGLPYAWQAKYYSMGEGMVPNDAAPWEIDKVAFDGSFEMPDTYGHNSYSVETINRSLVPWLQTDRFSSRAPHVKIFADTPYPDFVRLIQEGGGTVYVPLREVEQKLLVE